MRARTRFVLLLLLLPCLDGCGFGKIVGTRDAPVLRAGETIVYLEPCPAETQRLRFQIQAVEGVAEDGSRVALTTHLAEVRGAARAQKQTLLASGQLPPGAYRGIAVRIGQAFLLGEEGESALLVPETDIQVAHSFQVAPDRSTLLFLSLLPTGNVQGGVRFTPAFALDRPRSELISVVGYVTNEENDSLTIFNKVTMNVIGMIATGRTPKGIVLDNFRNRAYVALAGDAAVQVIDLFKETVETRIPLIFGDRPRDLALTPDGRTLVVVNEGSDSVSLIDTLSLFETRRVAVGQGPVSVTVPRDGTRAFVMNARSNSVSVVNLSQGAVTLTVSTDGSPLRSVFDAAGRKLFIVYANIPYLTALDDLRFSTAEKTFIGMGATFIALNNPANLLLVAMAPSRELTVLDPFSSVVINSLNVPGRISYMVYDSQQSSLYAVFPEQRSLRKLNVINGRTVGEIELARGAYAVAVMGEN